MTPALTGLHNTLKRKKLDALYISNPANVSYLSGFRGDDSMLFVGRDGPDLFLTDFRYLEQAKREIRNFKIVCLKRPLMDKIVQVAKSHGFKRIGFESMHLSYRQAKLLMSQKGIRFLAQEALVERLRINKSPQEIKLIEQAVQITKIAVDEAIGYIKPGMSELEVAGYIEWRMRKRGAEKIAFHTIVASGKNAYMPHSISSDKKIKMREPIIIDCGCVFCGYNSDLTRTIFLGRIDAQFKYIYNTINTAQKKAISIVRPGVKISAIDRMARTYITKKGLGKYFGHATGHGVGCQVHEAPNISSKNNKILKPGMVFTVEPAAYIPGWGGVRIEDIVLVTESSHKVISR